MADSFVSYAHADRALTQPILDALTMHKHSFLMDDELLPMTNWWEEIQRFIDQSTAFVFMLSPHSIQSDVCTRELAYAAEMRKRLIVIWLDDDGTVLHGVEGSEAGAYISSGQQWIDFRDPRVFDDKLKKLLFALDNDIVYWKQSTSILEQAREWETNDFDRGRLLRGKRLSEAQRVLEESFEKDVRPADALVRFISASRRSARARQRWGISFLSTGLILVTAVSLLSLNLYRISVNQRNQALRERNAALLVVDSQAAQGHGHLDLALLLSLEANLTSNTQQTRQALLSALTDSPHLKSFIRSQLADVVSIAISPDSSYLLLGGQNGSLVEHDLATGKETPFPEAPTEHNTAAVAGIVVTPDGKRTVTYSNLSSGFLVWNTQKRALLARLPTNTHNLGPWIVTSDGQHLVAGICVQQSNGVVGPNLSICGQYAIQSWNIVTNRLESTLYLPRSDVNTYSNLIPLGISPNGTLAVVAMTAKDHSRQYQLWSTLSQQTASEAITLHEPIEYGGTVARFSPDGTEAALLNSCPVEYGPFGTCSPTLELLSLHGQQLLSSTDFSLSNLAVSTVPVSEVEFGPEGTLYVVDGDVIYESETTLDSCSQCALQLHPSNLANTHEANIEQ